MSNENQENNNQNNTENLQEQPQQSALQRNILILFLIIVLILPIGILVAKNMKKETHHHIGQPISNIFSNSPGHDAYFSKESSDDTYTFDIGDGFDWIDDFGGTDTISFGEGITLDDVTFHRGDDNLLYVNFPELQGGISINHHFDEDGLQRIEKFVFTEDGTIIEDVTPYLSHNL